MTSLRVYSYNMHGYRQGEIFLKINIGKFDIVLLQEHWLFPGSLNLLANIDNNYEFNAVSFMIVILYQLVDHVAVWPLYRKMNMHRILNTSSVVQINVFYEFSTKMC